jgi:predicted dehydrogenase
VSRTTPRAFVWFVRFVDKSRDAPTRADDEGVAMKTWRIGVIGLGQRIAHVLAAMAEVGWNLSVGGHVDPAPVGMQILGQAGIEAGRAFDDPGALFAAGPFDLIMIGSPNHLHLAHLKAAIGAGWPIFAEKPIVRTAEETFELAHILATTPAPPIFIGLVMRSMPIVREVIARVDAGELGTVVSMDATEHLHPEHGGYLARNWRRRAEWGGSYLLDKVCHDFDIFGRIAGSRASKVASFGGRAIFHADRTGIPSAYDDGSPAYALRDAGWAGANDAFHSDMDVADHQTAIVHYAGGMALAFHSNTHVALQERRWYVAGTEGTLIADLVRNRLMIRRAMSRDRPERMDFGDRTDDNHNGADQAMARDLLAALEGRAAFPVSPADSMEAGLTVMAIDEAMDREAVVDCAAMWAKYDSARGGG